MASLVCTLFEGDYHYGVATLINSLLYHNCESTIVVGYKNQLPNWIVNNLKKSNIEFENLNIKQFEIQTIFSNIYFIKIEDEIHFANYKPYFIKKLFKIFNIENIFYFDPDIVVKYDWRIFEEWVSCGIAVCEDVNSPLQEFHPRRVAWRNYFKDCNLKFKNSIYVNSGFIGVNCNSSLDIIDKWIFVQEELIPIIDSLKYAPFSGNFNIPISQRGDYAPFSKTDQDALNIALELTDNKISYIGKEGMGFIYGATIMLHALGKPKPWSKKYFLEFLKGNKPNYVESEYWKYVNFKIHTYSNYKHKYKLLLLYVFKLLGRFYSKN
ncbi:MAG: hypothetical protein U0U66_07770 [Cytophagaceae bacterium]